jgi:hypothetical protein
LKTFSPRCKAIAVTPVTPEHLGGVTAKALPLLGCRPVTPVTPQIIYEREKEGRQAENRKKHRATLYGWRYRRYSVTNSPQASKDKDLKGMPPVTPEKCMALQALQTKARFSPALTTAW